MLFCSLLKLPSSYDYISRNSMAVILLLSHVLLSLSLSPLEDEHGHPEVVTNDK